MNYIHIAERLFNEPLLVADSKLQVILNLLSPRMGFEVPIITANLEGAQDIRRWPNESTTQEGIRVIEISGTLVNRYATAPSGMTSYDRIRDQVTAAEADGIIRGIMLRIESYGGEVSGAWDTADVIRKASKPVWASIDDHAFSAAYLFAAQAKRVYATRTGGSGSVGIIAVHYDFSKFLEKQGVKPTPIYAGARKNDFSPDAPLTDDAIGRLRASVEVEYDRFLDYVAAGRSMSIEDVRKTEAMTYKGQEGVDIGFVDRIGTFEQALKDFAVELSAPKPRTIVGGTAANSQKGGSMAEPKTPAEQNPAETKQQASVDTEAIKAKAFAEGKAAGASESKAAERARVGAILGCDEAKGREELARTIALETDTEPAAAKKLLAAAPKATPAPVNPLAGAMAGVPNPKVGADGGSGSDDVSAAVRETVALYQGKEAK